MDTNSFIMTVMILLLSRINSNGLFTYGKEIELQQDGVVAQNKTKQSTGNQPCLSNEYGPNCTYCVPRDTCKDGHFTCDINIGSKICLKGYHGDDCKFPTNLLNEYHVTCPENTCRNGGTCTSGRCCCREGFTGILCEIEIIECKNHSCLNGGICKDLIGKFECLCKPRFRGDFCEIPLAGHSGTTPSFDSSCQSQPCKNNGTCLEDAFFTYCLCPLYYTGKFCERPIDNPAALPSSCAPNYYGKGCRTFCRPRNDCTGHFECNKATGDSICLSGWHGPRCDTRTLPQGVDPQCPKHGCKNDGQCFNKQCCCRYNYTGDYCQIESIGCLSNPCQNDATCINQGNGYACLCKANFTGKDCATEVTIPPSIMTLTTLSPSNIISSTVTATTPALITPKYSSKYYSHSLPHASFTSSMYSTYLPPVVLTKSSPQFSSTSSTHDSNLKTPLLSYSKSSSYSQLKPSSSLSTVSSPYMKRSESIVSVTATITPYLPSTSLQFKSSLFPSTFSSSFSSTEPLMSSLSSSVYLPKSSDSSTSVQLYTSSLPTPELVSSLVSTSILQTPALITSKTTPTQPILSLYPSLSSISSPFTGKTSHSIATSSVIKTSRAISFSHSSTYSVSSSFTNSLKTPSISRPIIVTSEYSKLISRFSESSVDATKSTLTSPSVEAFASSLPATLSPLPDLGHAHSSSESKDLHFSTTVLPSTYNIKHSSQSSATANLQPSLVINRATPSASMPNENTSPLSSQSPTQAQTTTFLSNSLKASSSAKGIFGSGLSKDAISPTKSTSHLTDIKSTNGGFHTGDQPLQESSHSSRDRLASSQMTSSHFLATSSVIDTSSFTTLIPEINSDNEDGTGISEVWQIALIVIACLLFLLAVVFLLVFLSIRQRRKDSRTITHSPSEIHDFSKEHFSTQPDFNNPAYDLENDSDDDSIKYDMYVVNK